MNTDHTPADASSGPGAQWPARRLQPCAVCCLDWQADVDTLLCRTCRAVDDLLAQRAGAAHFLPHIISRTRDGQPQQVMACALHSARFPDDTGFYGIYTTMVRILSATGRTRRIAAAAALCPEKLSDRQASSRGIADTLLASIPQPSHRQSLVAIASLVESHFACAQSWLAAHRDDVEASCEERDSQVLNSRSDFDTAQLTIALSRLEKQ